MSNFIPNETTLIDGRDSSWINKKIKGLFLEKNFKKKKSVKKIKKNNFRDLKGCFSSSGSSSARYWEFKTKILIKKFEVNSETINLKAGAAGVF